MSEMTTPAAGSEDARRFWCHQCRAEIRPTEAFACPGCGNDFIEEMEDVMESPEDDPTLFMPYVDPTASTTQQPAGAVPAGAVPHAPHPFAPFPFQTMFGPPGMVFGGTPIPATGAAPTAQAPPFNMFAPPPQVQHNIAQLVQQFDVMLQQMATPPPAGAAAGPHQPGQPPVMQVFTTGGPAPMNFQTFMHNMLSNLGMEGMVGNPGDYAFGNLDDIITRLMETAGDRGPPPASADVIESLPSVRIAQEAVDMHEACAICKDEFNLNEEVIKLDCEHQFHPSCIKEWLGRRNTCPVCRFELKAAEKPAGRDNGNTGNNGGNNGGRGNGRGGNNSNSHNSADSPMQFYL